MSVRFKLFWNSPYVINSDVNYEEVTYYLPLGGVSLPTDVVLDTSWGNIQGDINNQTDLIEVLNDKISSDDLNDVLEGYVTTTELSNELNDYVQKESGKGLSSNDFSDDDKDKLDNLENVNLTAGDNVTITGDYPNLTVAASGGGGDISNIIAYSPTTTPPSIGNNTNAIAIGDGASVNNNSTLSLAIGNGSVARGSPSIAIGTNAQTHGYQSINIGNSSIGTTSNIAIRNVVISLGGSSNGNRCNNSVLIGYNMSSDSHTGLVSIGSGVSGQGDNATNVGNYNRSGLQCTTLGGQIQFNNTYTNSSAIGYMANVTGSNQVQLGNSSTTTYVYGSVQDRSDRRDKSDIEDCELGLDFINSLSPKKWKWDYRDDYVSEMFPPLDKDDFESDEEYNTAEEQRQSDIRDFFSNPIKDGSKKRDRFHYGIIADELKDVLDSLGVDFGGYQDHSVKGGKDVKSVGYIELIAPLIKAIQELSDKNNELERRLSNLEI